LRRYAETQLAPPVGRFTAELRWIERLARVEALGVVDGQATQSQPFAIVRRQLTCPR
jgi:hypothetical protein